ncbi:MAG: nuclear transport factor 2 family protein [Spongiibacteraceae bacterium]|nr:nuclear transport factor 2 family protein [Spongiibacteraceae bacterium]
MALGVQSRVHVITEVCTMLDLEAIELIKQLKGRYFRFLDTCDLERFRTVFTDDAKVHFKSPTYEIEIQGWPKLEEFYRNAFTTTKYGMHHGNHPEIEVSGDTATGIWYLHDIFINEEEKTVFQGSALYEDRYVKQGGKWLIAYSGYERLLEIISPLPADWKIASKPVQA